MAQSFTASHGEAAMFHKDIIINEYFHNSRTAYITGCGAAAAAAGDATANRYLKPVTVLLWQQPRHKHLITTWFNLHIIFHYCSVHRCRGDHLSAAYYTSAGHVTAGVALAVANSLKSSAQLWCN